MAVTALKTIIVMNKTLKAVTREPLPEMRL
jgi:hypothetical protein